MLKTRIIGVVLIKEGLVVQSIGFARYLPVGSPTIAIEYLNRWGIDEIVLLDMTATTSNRPPQDRNLKEHCKFCHVPLAVGGGIRTIDDMSALIRGGADKVVINSTFPDNPSIVSKGAEKFGDQCIIVSIDARKIDGKYMAFTHSGAKTTGKTVVETAKLAEENGAGEVFLNSIDNDGMKTGFDLELAEAVRAAVDIPIIICGGAGIPSHFAQAAATGVSGVAAANFFHYTEHSVITAKTHIVDTVGNVRLDTYAEYTPSQIGDDGRLLKLPDNVLESLRFEYIPEEVI